jgi:hypothetical protein
MMSGLNARLLVIAGSHPSWIMPPGSMVVFNWGRHNTLLNGIPLAMRIYWTTTADVDMRWLVSWRWVQAIQPGAGPNPPPTSLVPLSGSLQLPARGFGPRADALQLNVTDFLGLEPARFEAEYLIVNITAPDVPDNASVHLLLVELMWEV